jgi:hypothetical protein
LPELIEHGEDHEFALGDVLMVERKMKEKVTGKRWVWRFFLVIAEHDKWSDQVRGYVVGNEKLKGKLYSVDTDDEKNTVHYLPQEEWPDGVYAFRTALILQRKIDL